MRETHKDGSEGVARAAVDSTTCNVGDDSCYTEVNSDITKVTCCCSSDLCNGQSVFPETTTHVSGGSYNFLRPTEFSFMFIFYFIMS